MSYGCTLKPDWNFLRVLNLNKGSTLKPMNANNTLDKRTRNTLRSMDQDIRGFKKEISTLSKPRRKRLPNPRKNGRRRQNNRKNQKDNQGRRTNRRTKAPVAYSNTTTGKEAIVRMTKTNEVRIQHTEYFGDIICHKDYGGEEFSINPGKATVFPWLSRIAIAFEKYEFLRLEFVYRTKTATSDKGTIMLRIEYNNYEIFPDSKQKFLSGLFVNSSCWKNFSYRAGLDNLFAVTKGKFIRTDEQDPDGDLNLYDMGKIQIAAEGGNDEFSGEMFVTYDVILQTPQTDTLTNDFMGAHLFAGSLTSINNDLIYGSTPTLNQVAAGGTNFWKVENSGGFNVITYLGPGGTYIFSLSMSWDGTPSNHGLLACGGTHAAKLNLVYHSAGGSGAGTNCNPNTAEVVAYYTATLETSDNFYFHNLLPSMNTTLCIESTCRISRYTKLLAICEDKHTVSGPCKKPHKIDIIKDDKYRIKLLDEKDIYLINNVYPRLKTYDYDGTDNEGTHYFRENEKILMLDSTEVNHILLTAPVETHYSDEESSSSEKTVKKRKRNN
jgi:Sec-independent protein translocase protein TatA